MCSDFSFKLWNNLPGLNNWAEYKQNANVGVTSGAIELPGLAFVKFILKLLSEMVSQR